MASSSSSDPEPHDKALLRVLRGETLPTPPLWLMRQAGRYLPEYRALRETVGGFLDLCLTPELAAEVTLQPVRRYALDAAILFSDILIVPYALGQALEYRDGEGPVLEPVRSVSDVASLSDADFRDRIAPVWRTVERVKDMLNGDVALIGFAGAPWTVAAYMVEGNGSRDFAAAKAFAFADPAGFGEMLDRLVDATVVYLDGQIRAGAEV
ncbi:MAG: uroporphyrinogen decarboxylase family protein, partial [Stellaceae bacterium]